MTVPIVTPAPIFQADAAYGPAASTARVISHAELDQLLQDLRSGETRSSRLASLHQAAGSFLFTSAQLVPVLQAMPNCREETYAIEILEPRLTDKANAELILGLVRDPAEAERVLLPGLRPSAEVLQSPAYQKVMAENKRLSRVANGAAVVALASFVGMLAAFFSGAMVLAFAPVAVFAAAFAVGMQYEHRWRENDKLRRTMAEAQPEVGPTPRLDLPADLQHRRAAPVSSASTATPRFTP